METFLCYEVVTKAYAFAVKAEGEPEAVAKIEKALWSVSGDGSITRVPNYDKTVDRKTECESSIEVSPADLIETNPAYIPDELRRLSSRIPASEEVLLPACKPSEFFDSTIETHFEKINLSRLLYFLGDMYE